MRDNARSDLSELKPFSGAGATLLAATGFAAAFGTASCCALPLFLSAVGLGGAWLVSLAVVAAPYRPTLLATASICLVGGALLLWRRQAAASCGPRAACGRSALTRATILILSLAAILTALGFVFA